MPELFSLLDYTDHSFSCHGNFFSRSISSSVWCKIRGPMKIEFVSDENCSNSKRHRLKKNWMKYFFSLEPIKGFLVFIPETKFSSQDVGLDELRLDPESGHHDGPGSGPRGPPTLEDLAPGERGFLPGPVPDRRHRLRREVRQFTVSVFSCLCIVRPSST